MALPSSGPLTMANIQTEFGGSNPIGLSEYYAGGGRVPAGTSGTYGAVPSSGTISIRNFYGTSNVPALSASASPTDVSGFDTVTAPDNSTATTDPTTVTPSGGVSPYTYAWTYVSGSTATVNSSTSATTTFSRTVFIDFSGQQIDRTGVYRCTVTDSASQTATADVTVNTTSNGI